MTQRDRSLENTSPVRLTDAAELAAALTRIRREALERVTAE